MIQKSNVVSSAKSTLREGGTYLITGGMGELGYVFAGYIAKKTQGNLILTGRREINHKIQARLQELREMGADVTYVTSDISKVEDVQELYQKIKKEYGTLQGILHIAGVNKDSFLLKKNVKELSQVLSAKVEGTRVLDETFAKEELDFFVLFSSIAAVFGNAGQSDYGFANSFMDSYAAHREQLREQGERYGRTISINWPLWDQGMCVDDETRKEMEQGSMQIQMLHAEEGIAAFEQAFHQPNSQFIVVKGNQKEIDQVLLLEQEKRIEDVKTVQHNVVTPTLLPKVQVLLKEIVAKHTKIAVSKIKDTEEFGNYGIDSIVIMGLTKSLEERIGRVAKTLFFEYKNIEELSHFLVKTKKKELEKLFGIQEVREEKQEQTALEKNTFSKVFKRQARNWFVKKQAENTLREKVAPSAKIEGNQEIAIIGLSGRYPMADNLQEFWDNLKNGKDCITEIPSKRWNHADYYEEKKGKPGKTYSKWGGFVNDIEMFDPLFFHIPPVEAEFLDPHERILLETVWEAFEDSGYTPESLKEEKVGVFTGMMYALYQLYETNQYGGKLNGRSSFASTANRISYLFDLKGPSIALDTMCSSALTALSLACESIQNGTSSMAVVGGVNFNLHPSKYVQLSQGGFLSTDGRCRSFGEGGDGYVPGEGSGAAIIKPLKKALEDGDHIYGIIRGIQINAGGKTSGYTVPNLNAQRELIQETLQKSGVTPESIQVVEAHGTGTALGDPIEIEALKQAYGTAAKACSIGSVKSNIGHLEAASGMASLTKVLLEMKYKTLVPSLHSEKRNPFIHFEETPFYVQQELEEWKKRKVNGREVPRRAAISAFGAGGSNAHLIVEELEESRTVAYTDKGRECLFVLSAKKEDRLKEYVQRLCTYLKSEVYRKNNYFGDADKINQAECVEFQEKVLTFIADFLGVSIPELDLEDNVRELGIDAYAIGSLSSSLMSEYPKIKLEQEELMNCKTVSELVECVHKKAAIFDYNRKAEMAIESHFESSLEDIAYTLQVGRQAMEYRLAVIASDRAELVKSLEDYLQGKESGTYKTGNINEAKAQFENMLSSKGIFEYLTGELKKRNFEEVAGFWVMGAQVDWNALYEGDKHYRVSLPTYPFARERCWMIPDDGTGCLLPSGVIETHDLSPVQESIPVQQEFSMSECDGTAKELTQENLEEAAKNYLKEVFSKVLKMPSEHIDENEDYENFGLDSIYIGKLNQYLQCEIGELPSTLFFTYKNIRLLARYLAKEKKEQLQNILSKKGQQAKEVHIGQNSSMLHANGKETVSQKSINRNLAESKEQAGEERTIKDSNDIAIIGISGRFPKAEGLDEYFENLKNGRDCISTVPKERWDVSDYPEIACKWGGFIEDADKFDPQFFNIAPIMATFMDPQERIFLEAVWSCLEDAGYTPKAMENPDELDTRGNVAVYAGVTFNEYGLYGAEEIGRGKKAALNSQIYSIANRVSYLFNFGGPSLSVDTACSSSLYAVHLACSSILAGEAEMAIAGGVNLSLHPSKYITLDWAKFLSSDGHCHTFGKDGDGYVPGEGTGAVLLKPLWKAKQDNDHIYAVIKGSAVNHDGKTYGYSVPNPVAQSAAIQKAVKKAGVSPRTISYVEAHGTGTSLGDPIEITALSEVYQRYTKEKQYCSIGSVKSNIGHLEAAAGISQVLKVVLQMKYKTLVPSRLNSDGQNPNIQFTDTPFYVQQKEEEWKRPVIDGVEYPRRAGISAFGVGGVNVHMILEEYEETEKPEVQSLECPVVITCSAKNESALQRYVKKIYDWIRKQDKVELPDIRDMSYTMHIGRMELAHRVAFLVKNYEELEQHIQKFLNGQIPKGVWTGKVSSLEERKQKEDAENWQQVQDPAQIAECWTKGITLDFNAMYQDYKPKRVSLPVYPFEKEAYWMYTKERQTQKEDVQEEAQDVLEEQQGVLEQLSDVYEEERRTIVIGHIQKLFAQILYFTEGRLPDPEEGFFALGLESVATRQALIMLEEEFQVSLDEQVFFNYPNITELSDYILSILSFDGSAIRKEEQTETIYYKEQWFDTEHLAQTVDFGRGTVAIIELAKEYEEKIQETCNQEVLENVIFYPAATDFVEAVKAGILPDKVVFAKYLGQLAQEDKVKDRIYQNVLPVFEVLKGVMEQCDKNICLYYFFLNDHSEKAAEYAAINGLFKSVMMENQNIHAKTIGISDEKALKKQLIEILTSEIKAGCVENEIQYMKGRREVRKLYDVRFKRNIRCKFKSKGVYLITGGFGGLGRIIAAYLSKEYAANLILCGRRAWNDEMEDQRRHIEEAGGTVHYIRADISEEADTRRLVEEAKELFGRIDGVIHAAGIIEDDNIQNKSEEVIKNVLAPKVFGTSYLDQYLGNEKIDFFLLFSSVSSVLGNAGQSDYCYANRYMDNFAEIRNKRVKRGERKGRTIVINWSFWKDGEMNLDEIQEKWMKRKFGLVLMGKKTGIEALESSLKADSSQVIVLNGLADKIRGVLGIPKLDEEESFDLSDLFENELNQEEMDEINNLGEEDLIALLKKELQS